MKFEHPILDEVQKRRRSHRPLVFNHLFVMPIAAEVEAAQAQGRKAAGKILFQAWNRKWYKLADVAVNDLADVQSLNDWLRTAEPADYHHAVRYGQPLKKTDLPQFLFKKEKPKNAEIPKNTNEPGHQQ